MQRGLVFLLVCLFVCSGRIAGPALADAQPSERGSLTLLFENDLFFHTDRDYTNGVLAAYTTAPSDTPDWARAAAHLLPIFPRTDDVRASYALGQNMYTPTDVSLANPPRSERPYAGYLYAALGLVAEEDDHLDQLQLQIGVVGPASLAEQTQKFVHKVVHATHPEGWATQLKNEPGVVLIYERSWRNRDPWKVMGLSAEMNPHVGAAVGNVYDYANAGVMMRFGYDLFDDYGPMRIDPGLPGSNFYEPRDGDFSWYVFAGLDGRLMGRNLFLDGNTFQSSRSVAKLPLVGDLQFGAAVSFRHMRVAFTHVFRTKEYRTQPGVDQFGAVSVSFRF